MQTAALLMLAAPITASAAVLSWSAATVNTTYTQGTAAPGSVIDTITSDDGSAVLVTGITVGYSSAGANWLSFAPQTGSTPLPVILLANPTGLAVGSYVATVTFAAAGGTGSVYSMAYTLTINSSGGTTTTQGGQPNLPTITATPAAITFEAQFPGRLPVTQALTVTTSDFSNFTVTPQPGLSPAWLTVSPGFGPSGGSVTLTANPAGLELGTYASFVLVSAGQGFIQVPVTLNVVPTALTPDPKTISFSMPARYGVSPEQPIQVSGPAGTPFNVLTQDPSSFILVDTVDAVAPAVVNVRFNTSGLDPGTYTGTVILAEGPNYQVPIPVTLTVGPPATLGLAPSGVTFRYQTADPAPPTQTVRISSLNGAVQNFSITTTQRNGSTNWLTLASRTGTTPGTVTIGVDPTSLPAGTYTGYISITSALPNSSPEAVNVTLIVTGIGRPVISAVTNSASYTPGVVALGEIVTLFGTALGPKTPVGFALNPGGKSIATTLAGTKVTFDGIAAPILYASDTQTSVQVPYGLTSNQTGSPANIRVQYATIDSAAATAIAVDFAVPGIFTVNSAGFGQAVAVNQNGTLNGPGSPAARGSIVAIFVTGEGATFPRGADGAITQPDAGPPYAPPVFPAIVLVGGQPARVIYADRAPASLSGVMQVNFVVPDTAPQGPGVSLQVRSGSKPAQENVTIFIQ